MQYLETIDRNGQHLLQLIDDILDLSKVEACKVQFEKVNFDLGELLKDFTSLMQFNAEEKGISFQTEYLSPIPQKIVSDPLRLRQILSNVVGNAIKFTKHGLVMMGVEVQGQTLSLTVNDSGVGMSEEQIKNLFKPFSQADAATTRKFGGTGLGLVLSKRLAQAMGGDVTLLRSRPRTGSTFRIQINFESVAESPLQFEPSKEIVESPLKSRIEIQGSLKEFRILLVDDSIDNQHLVSLVLHMSGAEVDVAGDGLIAIDKALKQPYDVILMDMQMPVLDGIEATRRLRTAGYDRPIIALTAHAMNEEREKSIRAGCSDHLSKPLKTDVLVQTILRHAKHAQEQVEAEPNSEREREHSTSL